MRMDLALMRSAEVFADLSYCRRSKVGAVISKDGRIISTGYNGMPRGMDNECEDNNVTKDMCIHAEANAILFAARNGIATLDSDLHVTLSPCMECSKLIIQSGIKRIVFRDEYRNTEAIEFLKKNGISVSKMRYVK